jgi:hypothetical protein
MTTTPDVCPSQKLIVAPRPNLGIPTLNRTQPRLTGPNRTRKNFPNRLSHVSHISWLQATGLRTPPSLVTRHSSPLCPCPTSPIPTFSALCYRAVSVRNRTANESYRTLRTLNDSYEHLNLKKLFSGRKPNRRDTAAKFSFVSIRALSCRFVSLLTAVSSTKHCR